MNCRELTKRDIDIIKEWPEYLGIYSEMDEYLRDGGLPEIWYGKNDVKIYVFEEDKNLIAFTILKEIDRNSADFGIYLRNDKTSKGFGYEIAEKTLRIGFDEIGYCRIVLIVRPFNIRAKKLYEKLGFKTTGKIIQEIRKKPLELYEMAIDKADFMC